MEARLLPLNTLLGLLIPGDINPPLLAEAGFRVAGLEVPASGTAGTVVIDVLLLHGATNHLVACESKAGANIEETQAKAYGALTAANVVRSASISLTTKTQPTMEVLYLCRAGAYADRIRVGLKTAQLTFPVLAVDGRRVELMDREFASEILRAALPESATMLVVPPARILPFDADSPQAEILPRVMATLIELMAQRVAQITITSLTERTVGHYALYGHKAQNRLRDTVADAVRTIVSREEGRFALDGKTGTRPDPVVRILRTPEEFDPRGRTQGYQALGRSVSSQSRRTLVNSDQLDLLRELELAEAVNDEEESAPQDEAEVGGQT